MKKQLLLILGLMFTATIFAAPVTKEAAKKNVVSFLQSRNGGRMFANAGMNQVQLTQVDYEVGGDAFYVFNIGKNGGFVITAADDRVKNILGYSYEGSFDPENVPENMKNWLNFYAKEINAVKEINLSAPSKKFSNGEQRPYRHSIPMMITCKWSQDTPYNDDCPQYPGDRERRPTGCVATAMAQVMYYHQWPKDAIASIPGYTFYDDPTYGGNGQNKDVEALEGTTFNWNLLEDEYNYNSTKESKQEVAKLMRYCGQALKMGYHPYASGAFTFDMPGALRTYLGYDKGVKYIDKAGYGTLEWEDIIYNEILNNRPVLYSGMSKGAGGHQFVCDGYENGYFHFNWGWAGMSDGYFVLTSLEPTQQGIGGNGLNFSDGQQAVIGVQPPVEGTVQPTDVPRIKTMYLTKAFDGVHEKNNLGKVKILLDSYFGYNSEHDAIITIGYGLYDAHNNLVEVPKQLDKQFVTGGLEEDKYISGELTLSKEAVANDGIYYLRSVYKDNSGKFVPVPGSEKVYFEIKVSGESVYVTSYPIVKVNITNIQIDKSLFQSCKSLMRATIENKSDIFEGTIYLTNNGKLDKAQIMPILLRKGEKKDIEFTFYPMSTGEQSFGLSANGSCLSEEVTVNVNEIESKSASLEFKPEVNITSSGNFFDIPVEITNKSAKNSYIAPVKATLYIKSGSTYKEVKSVYVPISLEASATATTNVHIDGLEFNKFYHLAFSFYQYNREKLYGGTDSNGNPVKTFTKFKTADALSYYDVDGNMYYKVVEQNETFDIPANACYVKIPKTISGRTINKSANTNCVYEIKPGVSTSQFSGCNIVRNGASTEMNLTNASDFLAFEPFSVSVASVSINVNNTLTTLYLPFEPQSVTCDGVELKKAGSVAEYAESDYAVLPFVAEEADKIYCDFDPLYIAAPSCLFVKNELVGKTLVFSAERVKFNPTSNIIRGNYFNIHASNRTSAYTEPIYGFGISKFTKSHHSATPFSVYLTSVGDTDVNDVTIVYPEGMLETGIEEVNADMSGKMVSVYTIDGVKVRTAVYGEKMLEGLPSGLYIVNGKKFVK